MGCHTICLDGIEYSLLDWSRNTGEACPYCQIESMQARLGRVRAHLAEQDAKFTRLRVENAVLIEALTPSGETKKAYCGDDKLMNGIEP